jgi:glycosyltransferase involved in cell wall biosynthesis
VIEALWAGLPLILSDRVGNHPETLLPGENGWLFNPDSLPATRDVLERWIGASTHELDLQGRASARLAEERFRTERVVNVFLDQVLGQNLRVA